MIINNNINCDLSKIHKELNDYTNLLKHNTLNENIINQLIEEVFDDEVFDDKESVEIEEIEKSEYFEKLKLSIKKIFSLIWFIIKITILIILVFILISLHLPTQKFLLRHSQDMIYPIMRQVRLLTLPVIKRYDYLKQWHVEECLVNNPFYVGNKLDCWPCEDIRTIVDLTGLNNYSKAYSYNSKPFIVKDVMNTSVTLGRLREIYLNDREALDFGTSEIESNLGVDIKTLNDLLTLEDKLVPDTFWHVSWKLNRVESARVMRRVFVRPHFVPHTSEVAIQRYVFIDGPHSTQYRLPLTDFANVWLTQADGYRLIVLDPTEMCRSNCSTVSIVLHPKDVLYYNWQFWRPRSLPARLTQDLSITYMASFY